MVRHGAPVRANAAPLYRGVDRRRRRRQLAYWEGVGVVPDPTHYLSSAVEGDLLDVLFAWDIRNHEGRVLRGLPVGVSRDERRPVVVIPTGVDEHLAVRQCGVDRR